MVLLCHSSASCSLRIDGNTHGKHFTQVEVTAPLKHLNVVLAAGFTGCDHSCATKCRVKRSIVEFKVRSKLRLGREIRNILRDKETELKLREKIRVLQVKSYWLHVALSL